MKALGVALAACCAAVFWPSAAHANPIGTKEAAAEKTSTFVPGWQALDGDADADDGVFRSQAGLDHSVHFASTGSVDVFNDDRVSVGDVIDLEGLGMTLNNEITLGLRKGANDADNDRDDSGTVVHAGAPPAPHAPKVGDPPAGGPGGGGGGGVTTSATPEPGSMLLLATGLVGLVCFRRQLFA